MEAARSQLGRDGRARPAVDSLWRLTRRQLRLVALLGLVLCLASASGCRRKARPKRTSPPPPEPIVPTAAAGGATAAPHAKWLQQLPATSTDAEVGSRVWAAVPEAGTDLASVGLFTVEHADSGRTTLVDKMGQKVRDVPSALVHPTGSSAGLRAGDVALCYSWTASATLARVEKVRGGHVVAKYDWAGITKQSVMDHAEPLRSKIEPLAFVGYPKFGHTSKGLVIALGDDQAWVLTGSGHVEVHPRAAVTKLPIRARDYRAGDAVRAYSWTGGFEEGTIRKVVEERVRYAVALQGDRAERTYFFADLIPAG